MTEDYVPGQEHDDEQQSAQAQAAESLGSASETVAVMYQDPFAPEVPEQVAEAEPKSLTTSVDFDPKNIANIAVVVTSEVPDIKWEVEWDDGSVGEVPAGNDVARHTFADTTKGKQYNVKVIVGDRSLVQPIQY